MYRVLTCLTVEHDIRLVFLAGLICAAGTLASFNLYSHVASNRGFWRICLLLLTGICSASSIWATHFIAMLAYDGGVPIAYEPVATAGSFLIAVVATTAGFSLALHRFPGRTVAGGAVIGAGIGCMHYTGMYALVVPGVLQWEPALVAASVVIGVGVSALAIDQFFRMSGRRAIWTAAGLLTLAICGLHFTAMSAAIVVPDPAIAKPLTQIDTVLMAFAVSGATLVIMLTGIASTALMENNIRKQREEELRVQNLRFDMALDNMGEGLCMFDADKRLVVCNKRYAEMYRLPPELLVPGTPHQDIIKHRVVHGILKGEANESAASRIISALHALPSGSSSRRIDELSDGSLICVTRQPTAGGGWVATHLDVTEQQRSAAQITYMAQHDALTDLPNRVLLRERLEKSLARTRRGERRLAVLMLDLDRFKEVNDTLGHPVGDILLKAVADRLRACVRATSTIARLGGDEFAIVEDVKSSVSEASALADRIQQALAAPFDLDGCQTVISTSIGIALAPCDSTQADEILKKADLALYRAKSNGRGLHCFFEPEMDRILQAKQALERDMRCALVRGEFELHYQPFVNFKSGEISGFEALVRWRHPVRGLISPAEFIPLAEETGVIVPLGEWVLRTACAEAAGWPDHLMIAVNLSPAQFRCAELVPVVVGAMASAGITPDRLELEVTESAIMHDRDVVFGTLRQLRMLGVRVALDDFGTGYSSLSFLQKFPFDKVKIDRTFIHALFEADEEARLIANAVLRFAVSLGKTTTAEGVETKEQADMLRSENCTEMQGYFFSPPRQASEIPHLFFDRKASVSAA